MTTNSVPFVMETVCNFKSVLNFIIKIFPIALVSYSGDNQLPIRII